MHCVCKHFHFKSITRSQIGHSCILPARMNIVATNTPLNQSPTLAIMDETTKKRYFCQILTAEGTA
jgi:hypothetical protein